MEDCNIDFNNSMEEQENSDFYYDNEKNKALEEANNTMFSGNKEKQIKKKKLKENNKNKKPENKINNIINEIDEDLKQEEENININNLEIDNIFEINNKFNYPKELPVFYLKDELNENDNENESHKSPLSTNKLKELLKSKKIKPYLLNIKLIDIFIMKNHLPFSFFSFNEILTKNWSQNLEYSDLFINTHNKLSEKEKQKEKSKEKKENKKIEIFNKKEVVKPKKENKKNNKKEQDMTLSLNFSGINQQGFNDLSMSIIKQLEGISLTKKQVDKITSIIEEVEEDEWTEVKTKKKEKEKEEKSFEGIVGLNDNKKGDFKNKKNQKNLKKKNNFNDNNQFSGLKIEYDD